MKTRRNRPAHLKSSPQVSLSPDLQREEEIYSPPVEPFYANKQFDLYYPKKSPEAAEEANKCPITPEVLEYILRLDLTQVLDKVDVNRSAILRKIKAIDEKLNSPQCKFLEAYQPNILCSCEETVHPDSQCSCPPAKEPLSFILSEKKDVIGYQESLEQDSSQCCRNTSISSPTPHVNVLKPQNYVRNELEGQINALQDKLNSSALSFLSSKPRKTATCTCQKSKFPQAECACLPQKQPLDFRNRNEVQRRMNAMDDLLNSPEYGLPSGNPPSVSRCSCGSAEHYVSQCACSGQHKIKFNRPTQFSGAQSGAQKCLPDCPPQRCRCGRDCPSKPGPLAKFPEQTFHVPGCPSDRHWMIQPRSPVEGLKACPFSPACCPLGDVCPFPVATLYDPKAPPLPTDRRCPLVPTIRPSSSDNGADPSRPPCPLDPLKPPRCPPTCPLAPPTSCPMGQSSDCPLLTCSIGPLKTFVFDPSDECPFCHNKCCPMITPDGPGCPIAITSNFCPLGNTDVCALKGLSPPPTTASKLGSPTDNAETCPIGDLLEANAKLPGCRCANQRGACPLSPPKSCPAGSSGPQSSCYCASASNQESSPGKVSRPESCPFGNINVSPPPAPPCPLTTPAQTGQCPMTNIGGKNFDESCPVANMFECPALKRKPIPTDGSIKNEQKPEKDVGKSEDKQVEPTKKDVKSVNKNSLESPRQSPPKSISKKTAKVSSDKKPKMKHLKRTSPKIPDKAFQHFESDAVGKVENMRRQSFSMASHDVLSVSTNNSTIFEVSLEALPRPPRSDSMLLGSSYKSKRTLRQLSPLREDAPPFVQTSAPSDTKGFERQRGKSKPKNCPFPEPDPCPLEVPKCVFGPPEPSCPLAKSPNCPLQGGGGCCRAGMMLNPSTVDECPVKTEPCDLFPDSHCPMENLNVCDCNYPVAPCMEPFIPEEDVRAEEQYCSRLDCCMGLPLPPTKPSEEFETDTWYAFTDVKPGHPVTKHYLEILDVPPEPEFFVSVNQFRQHPAWKIIKYGEGYQECKKIKEILAARGPTSSIGTQFVADELPDDEEIDIIEENQKNAASEFERIRRGRTEGWIG